MCPHFPECLFEGLCLFVSPLTGCAGSSTLHRESSIFVVSRASHCPRTHSMASAASACFPVRPLGTRSAPPRGACAWVRHPVQGRRVDRPAASRYTKRLLSPLLVSPLQILQRAPAVPTTRVLDRMGALGTMHSPVWGWHSSSPQNLREWP